MVKWRTPDWFFHTVLPRVGVGVSWVWRSSRRSFGRYIQLLSILPSVLWYSVLDSNVMAWVQPEHYTSNLKRFASSYIVHRVLKTIIWKALWSLAKHSNQVVFHQKEIQFWIKHLWETLLLRCQRCVFSAWVISFIQLKILSKKFLSMALNRISKQISILAVSDKNKVINSVVTNMVLVQKSHFCHFLHTSFFTIILIF